MKGRTVFTILNNTFYAVDSLIFVNQNKSCLNFHMCYFQYISDVIDLDVSMDCTNV